jgi:hypothetical protein
MARINRRNLRVKKLAGIDAQLYYFQDRVAAVTSSISIPNRDVQWQRVG